MVFVILSEHEDHLYQININWILLMGLPFQFHYWDSESYIPEAVVCWIPGFLLEKGGYADIFTHYSASLITP